MTEHNWAAWVRSNADKYLLFFLLLILLGYGLHVSHDGADKDLVHWTREITGTVLGGLLGLIQGARLSQQAQLPQLPQLPQEPQEPKP